MLAARDEDCKCSGSLLGIVGMMERCGVVTELY